MLSQGSINNGARWQVIWLGKRGLVHKDFEHDFSDALHDYYLLKSHGKKIVTLRCCNVGFPPPAKLAPKMSRYNERGIYWCPYCITLRPFKTAQVGRRVLVVCPVCTITSRDWYVRHFNPKAITLEYRRTRGRRRRTRGRVRKRS